MKQFYFLIIFLLFQFQSFAGGETTTIGAKHTAMGRTNLNARNVFSAHNNPAGIGFVKKIGFGIYAEQAFLTEGVNRFNISGVIPVQKVGAFGLDLNYFGYEVYNETRLGFSYARSFSEKFSFGVKFDYLRLFVQNQEANNKVAFGIGLQYEPIKQLRIAANVYNPISMEIDNLDGEKLATNFGVGLSYLPSEKLTINVEAEKEIDQKIQFKAGVEYQVLKPLFLRIGAATNPTLITFGVGTKFNNFKLDAAISWHLSLGITPQLSLVYNFKQKEKVEKK